MSHFQMGFCFCPCILLAPTIPADGPTDTLLPYAGKGEVVAAAEKTVVLDLTPCGWYAGGGGS